MHFKHSLPDTVSTPRLTLARPSLAHVPPMAVLANNARIHQVLSRLPHPYSEWHGREFVTTIARGPTEHAWAILQDGAFIGTIGLHIQPDRLPELGYWLGEPHWGYGFATEAGQAVVTAAKAAGARGLHARALVENTASRNVLTKLGFIEIGQSVAAQGSLAGQKMALMRIAFEP